MPRHYNTNALKDGLCQYSIGEQVLILTGTSTIRQRLVLQQEHRKWHPQLTG